MPTQDVSEILTPAARQILEEAVKDYRAQVLSAAEASASRLIGEVREISVHDVLRGLAAAQPRLARRHSTQTERILYLYGASGLVIAAFSIVYWLLWYSSVAMELAARLPLLLAASGLPLSIVSFVYLRFRSIRLSDQYGQLSSLGRSASFEFAFMSQWRDLEIALRRLAAAELGESGSAVPFSALVNAAVKTGALSPGEAAILRRLINLRNRILHKGDDVSATELQDAIDEAERLRGKLENVSQSNAD